MHMRPSLVGNELSTLHGRRGHPVATLTLTVLSSNSTHFLLILHPLRLLLSPVWMEMNIRLFLPL